MFDDNGNFNEKKARGFVMRWWMYGILLIVIASIISYALWAGGYIFQQRVVRTANRESQQMVQSVTESLRKDYESWIGLNNQIGQYKNALTDPQYSDPNTQAAIKTSIKGVQSQQKALVLKMHTDADSLTPSGYGELPQDIRDFLTANP